MSPQKKSRSKLIFSGQPKVPYEKPTRQQAMSAVYHGLREVAWKWRERRIDDKNVALMFRRAESYSYFTNEKIQEITGIPLQEIERIKNDY